MGAEDEYLDVLQNIEFAIVQNYQNDPETTDYDVQRALESLVSRYQAEGKGQAGRAPALTGREHAIFDSVQSVCEWRMGRKPLGTDEEEIKPITLDALVQCLKRIRKSVEKWNKRQGRRGYLDFVSQHVK